MKITADVLVIETRATDSISPYPGPTRLAAVEVRAAPYNSSNLVREITFVLREEEAPRVGTILNVTVETEEKE